MSWVYRLNDESRISLASLPVWLQEDTFDELEKLVANPHEIAPRGADHVFVYDFTRDVSRTIHYLFVTIDPDYVDQALMVVKIGHFQRSY